MIAVRFWRICLLLVSGLLPAALSLAAPAEILPDAESIITRAAGYGTVGNYDGAIKLLDSGTQRYPTYSRLYLELAHWQEAKDGLNLKIGKMSDYPDLFKGIFETFGRATIFTADPEDIQQRVATYTQADFPLVLGDYGPLALPGEPMPVLYNITDPLLPAERRGVYQGLITTEPLPVESDDIDNKEPGLRMRYLTDPKYGQDPKYANDNKYGGWTFSNILYAYDYDNQKHEWHLRFRVIWQDARTPRDDQNRQRLARNCAQVLLRCAGLLRAYTGMQPLFSADGSINVWLCEKGDAGGEAFNDSIYLQEVGITRSPAEWVRELAHEYGHQTLPSVGGYTKPEWSSSGLLGERLFLRWLLLNMDDKETQPWLRALDPTELKDERINRLVRQFAAIGPLAPQMRDTDANAMNGFVGMALYLDMTRGSEYLKTLLTQLSSPTYDGNDLGFLGQVVSHENLVQSVEKPVVTLHLRDLPVDTPLWVYLTKGKGTWRGEFERRDADPLTLKVSLDDKDYGVDNTGHFGIGDQAVGWHRLRITADADTMNRISALKLIRQ